MNSRSAYLGLLAMSMAFSEPIIINNERRRIKHVPEETEGDKARHEQRYKSLMKRKGLEFTIDGHIVTAINYKNALKKVEKLKISLSQIRP